MRKLTQSKIEELADMYKYCINETQVWISLDKFIHCAVG